MGKFNVDEAIRAIKAKKELPIRKALGEPVQRRRPVREGVLDTSEGLQFLLVGLDQFCVLAKSPSFEAIMEVAETFGDGVAIIYMDSDDFTPSTKIRNASVYNPSRDTSDLVEQIESWSSGSHYEEPKSAPEEPPLQEHRQRTVKQQPSSDHNVSLRLRRMRAEMGGSVGS